MYQSINELKCDYYLVPAHNFYFYFNDGRGDSFSFNMWFGIEDLPFKISFGGYQLGKSYMKFSIKGKKLFDSLSKIFNVSNVSIDLDSKEDDIVHAIFDKNEKQNGRCLGLAKLGWNWSDKKNAVNYILESEFI